MCVWLLGFVYYFSVIQETLSLELKRLTLSLVVFELEENTCF